MEIVEAKLSDLERFFAYLSAQLLDNALDETPLFQPIAKKHCEVSPELKNKFREGFKHQVGESGWRKLWLVVDPNRDVHGHIDLRHHSGDYRYHRVLLGMGVDAGVRKLGLGLKLIELVTQFCLDTNEIEWLDLNVLSNNLPAKNLYTKCNFEVIGEIEDCYRIDGRSVSELSMTLRTKNYV